MNTEETNPANTSVISLSCQLCPANISLQHVSIILEQRFTSHICVFVCFTSVGSTCCSYAGRHTTCREYCQAIFRTDSTPTMSQISAVKEYCQTHSGQLLNCVNNFTKSYPIRSPIDSKFTCTLHCRQLLLFSTAGWIKHSKDLQMFFFYDGSS